MSAEAPTPEVKVSTTGNNEEKVITLLGAAWLRQNAEWAPMLAALSRQ